MFQIPNAGLYSILQTDKEYEVWKEGTLYFSTLIFENAEKSLFELVINDLRANRDKLFTQLIENTNLLEKILEPSNIYEFITPDIL